MPKKASQVSYTLTLKWTKKEARDFARSYLRAFRSPDDICPFTIEEFLEAAEDECLFEEFIFDRLRTPFPEVKEYFFPEVKEYFVWLIDHI